MYLGHGTGLDDIAIMLGLIIVGLLLLRRSEKSVRTRAGSSESGPPEADGDPSEPPVEDSTPR